MFEFLWEFPLLFYHFMFVVLFWVICVTGLYAVVTFYWDKYKHKLSFPKKKTGNDDIDWENGV